MAKLPSVQQITDAVNRIAPFRLAESWDNVGLQVGNPAARVSRIMTMLELSSASLAEAVNKRVDLIVAHHPLLFRERKSYAERDPVSRLAAELVRRNIAFIAAHTNLDSVARGTNGVLADLLGMAPERRFLSPNAPTADHAKLAVFVPATHVEQIVDAIAKGGGGHIGNYSHCTFRVSGTGTFKGTAGTNPFLGKPGVLEQAEEFRIETIVPRERAARLVEAVRRAHPYEEMAYDLYPLEPLGGPSSGLGLVGKLAKATTLAGLAARAKKALRCKHPAIVGDPDAPIVSLAICTGSGGEFVRRGEVGGASCFVTGEMNHHDAWEARERGIPVLLVGHFASEAVVAGPLAAALGEALGDCKVPILVSDSETDPILTI